MDCSKVGKLIFNLRKEKNLTQKQLADIMNISDKTISKWERGLGCPDISLLGELSEIFGVNIEKILIGDLEANQSNGGNMKKNKFYVCKDCGNILTSTGEPEAFCCGRKLSPLEATPADENHILNKTEIDNDFYITFEHEMKKDHFINFIAYVSYDRMFLVKLYPEQNAEVRIPKMYGGKLYFGCTKHGLKYTTLNNKKDS